MLLPFRNNIKLKFVFVMIIYPMIFTSLQFWITDNIIKKSNASAQAEKENNYNNIYNEINNELDIKEIEERHNKRINCEVLNEKNIYKIDKDSITKPLLEKI